MNFSDSILSFLGARLFLIPYTYFLDDLRLGCFNVALVSILLFLKLLAVHCFNAPKQQFCVTFLVARLISWGGGAVTWTKV